MRVVSICLSIYLSIHLSIDLSIYPSEVGGGTAGCLEQVDEAIMAGLCGNGAHESPEACDDNNTVAGDGCGATCEVECGYTCTQPLLDGPSVCEPSCGNGVVKDSNPDRNPYPNPSPKPEP